jgi:hypothetical protein
MRSRHLPALALRGREADGFHPGDRRFNLVVRLDARADTDADAASLVDLAVVDADGELLFVMADAGPVVRLRLPYGRYRVLAIENGAAEAHSVLLEGSKTQEITFHSRVGPAVVGGRAGEAARKGRSTSGHQRLSSPYELG